ncbi:hypothetical protein BESB_029430 [Besnoitia besnoiti]|uniref:CPSF A subunit region protein n=1 Tax=Besnoitia besnoiti TaxID=94643 RepID=A0A2A9LYI8_BESBE|nr:uncharacterized protein BESB_029430 [Besnoitia besnoiti]PFH31508.1 hypothetical protein BESB_029430 [Besnoitia besnoiti]
MGTAQDGPSPPSASTLCYFVTSQLPGCARCSLSLHFRCPHTRTLVVARPNSLVFVHPKTNPARGLSAVADKRDIPALESGSAEDGHADVHMGEASPVKEPGRQNQAVSLADAGATTSHRDTQRHDEGAEEDEENEGEEETSWTSGEAFNPITLPLYADVFCMAAFPRVTDASRTSRQDGSSPGELEDLLVLTDRQILLLLRYDEEKQTVVTLESVDLKEPGSRFVDGGPLMAVCSATRCIAVYQYESLLQYIPLSSAAVACSPASGSRVRGLSPSSSRSRGGSLFAGVRLFRLDEHNLLDMCFLPPEESYQTASSRLRPQVHGRKGSVEGASHRSGPRFPPRGETPTEAPSSSFSYFACGHANGCESGAPAAGDAGAVGSPGFLSAHLCVLFETALGVVSSATGSLHRLQRLVKAVRLPLDDCLYPSKSSSPLTWTSPYLPQPLRVKDGSTRLLAPAVVSASRGRRARGAEAQGVAEADAPCLLILGSDEIFYLQLSRTLDTRGQNIPALGATRLDGGVMGPVVLRHRGMPPGLHEIVAVEQMRGDGEQEGAPDAAGAPQRSKVFLLGDVMGQIYMLILFETCLLGATVDRRRMLGLESSASSSSSSVCANSSAPRAAPWVATRMCVEWLGQASEPTGLSYLGNGVLFVASATSDSLLLRILDVGRSVRALQRDLEGPHFGGAEAALDGEAGGEDGGGLAGRKAARGRDGRLQLLQVFPNLGPIIDCCAADVEGHGQRLLIVACGQGRSTSLRFIRSGVALHPACRSIPLAAPPQGLWSLDLSLLDFLLAGARRRVKRARGVDSGSSREEKSARPHAAPRGPLAVLAFPRETRVLGWRVKHESEDEEAEKAAHPGSLDVNMGDAASERRSRRGERRAREVVLAEVDRVCGTAAVAGGGYAGAGGDRAGGQAKAPETFGFKRDATTLLAAIVRLADQSRRTKAESEENGDAEVLPLCCRPAILQVLPASLRFIDPFSFALLAEFSLAFSPGAESPLSLHAASGEAALAPAVSFAASVSLPCAEARGDRRGDALALALDQGYVACLELLPGGEDKVLAVAPRVRSVRKVCEEIAAFHAVGLDALAFEEPRKRAEAQDGNAEESCTTENTGEPGDEGLAAVADFDQGKVVLLALPSLKELASCEAYGDDIGIRVSSVLLCTMEDSAWLFVGLSDGRLVSQTLAVSRATSRAFSVRLAQRKAVHAGSEPLRLFPLPERRDVLRALHKKSKRLRADRGFSRAEAHTHISSASSASSASVPAPQGGVERLCVCWEVKRLTERNLAGVFCSGNRPALIHASKTGQLQFKEVPSCGVGAFADFASPFTDAQLGVLWIHVPSAAAALDPGGTFSRGATGAHPPAPQAAQTAQAAPLLCVGVRERAQRLQVRALPIGRTVDALCVLPEENLIVLACPREVVHPDGLVMPSCLLFVDPLTCAVEGCYLIPAAQHIAAAICVASLDPAHPALAKSVSTPYLSRKTAKKAVSAATSARGRAAKSDREPDDRDAAATGAEEAEKRRRKRSLLCVGTAEVVVSDSEPKEGLIILLDVRRGADGILVVKPAAHIHEVKSGVQHLRSFQGLLLAACNHRVRLFGLREEVQDASFASSRVGGGSEASEASFDPARGGEGGFHADLGGGRRPRRREEGREVAEMLQGHLELVCSHSSNAYVSSVDTWRDEVVCLGDMVASAVLLRFNARDKAFKEIARDTNACWALAVSCVTPDLHYLADADRNIWLLQRASLTLSEEGDATRAPPPSADACSLCGRAPNDCLCSAVCVRMSGVSYIHAGASINKIIPFPTHERYVATPRRRGAAEAARVRGPAADAAEAAEAAGAPGGSEGGGRGAARASHGREETRGVPLVVGRNSKLWVSSEGSIGLLLQIRDEKTFARLAVLQDAVTKATKNVGNLSTVAFHSVKVGSATVPSKGFLDGDLLERFLEFPVSVQKAVYEMAQLNGRIAHLTLPPLETVIQEIEELQRRH